MATVAFFIGVAPTNAIAKKNIQTQVAVPDFAYPKTVAKNADAALAKAIAHNDWPSTVEATIQTVTADNLISHDNATKGIAKIDSVANLAPDEWKPAFLLIEADILNSIYQSMPWIANERKLPADSVPENPYEWSRDIFASKITDICERVVDAGMNSNTPLKTWSKFITDTSASYADKMTIGEFLLSRCVDLLNEYADATLDIIPFFPNSTGAETPTQRSAKVRDKAIDSLIESYKDSDKTLLEGYALVIKSDFLPYSGRMKYLLSALDSVKGTEGEQPILERLCNFLPMNNDRATDMDNTNPLPKGKYIELLKASISAFPKGIYVNNLKNILNSLTLPGANILFTSQYLSSDSIAMDVELSHCSEIWILIYDYSRYINSKKSPKTSEVVASCRLVKAVKVHSSDIGNSFPKLRAEIGSLPKGAYVVVPSSTSDGKGIYATMKDETWRQPFRVSDISVLSIQAPDSTTKVIVVDGSNGRPIEGALVKVYDNQSYKSPRTLLSTLTTDKDGIVSVDAKRFEIEASYEGSVWTDKTRHFNSKNKKDSSTRHYAAILPERAICHPGDSLKAAIVAYHTSTDERGLDKDMAYTVILKNANYKEVASRQVTTDRYGRASVDFLIPNEGLLGNWQIQVKDADNLVTANTYIKVADYVAPTFFITTEKKEEELNPGDSIRVTGQVLTYSGMPLGGATVKYSVSYTPPLRWWNWSSASYDASVTTDSDGKYAISLPTSNLQGTQFERGIFSVSLSATSPAGETQSGPTERFALGNEYHIEPIKDGGYFEITDSVPSFTVRVYDMLGRPVIKEIEYTMTNSATNDTVASGVFMSPTLTLPETRYPSAEYDIEFTLKDNDDVDSDISVVFWRRSDEAAPQGTTLWVPESVIFAQPTDSITKITVGSGIADRWIPALVAGDGEIETLQWLHVEKDNLELKTPTPPLGSDYRVNLCYVSGLKTESRYVLVSNQEKDAQLEILTETFRDKINSGDKEHWKFRIQRKNGSTNVVPAMAVMSDAALNAITPFEWNFVARSGRSTEFSHIENPYLNHQNIHVQLRSFNHLPNHSIAMPELNDYQQRWGLDGYLTKGDVVVAYGLAKNEVAMTSAPMIRGAASAKLMSAVMVREDAVAVAERPAEFEDTIEEAEVEDLNDNVVVRGYGTTRTTEKAEFRPTECPVAFFMPYLVSDREGIVNINFTVPNYNTTWAFQLLGYDENVKTARIALKATASKPIMVSTHAPRFVRTGDRIDMTATVFNNSDKACSPKCRIELVDMISGKAIATKDFAPEPLDVAANRTISMEWNVPSGVSTVGFRAYAEAEAHRDGEQALVPVLPASSPIVESTPFWIAPGSDKMEVKLPKFNDTDCVTLQYCDNPAWYCLTALPDIVKPKSKSVLSKVSALYGNTVAYHLISSNSNLKKGLEILLCDSNSQFSALKSNLEKDGNLKITELNNTPWVNNAESETLRMSRLGSLLDSKEAENAIAELLSEVKNLQNADGGWSWCPEMKSSSWITREVVRHLSMISKAGASKYIDGYEKMIKSGVTYADKEIVTDYKRYHKKGESLSYLLDWLYVRSSLPETCLSTGSTGTEMNAIANQAVKDIASEWKDMGIGAKAKAATLLWRIGQRKAASEILESLRQYASESPEKGMWFDNLNSGWGGMSTIQTTTLVLEAFAEIQPSNAIVDQLRQWLVLGRQYQDWGANTYTVETVNAILTSGQNWAESGLESMPEFRLKGKKIELPEAARLTGAFTMNLSAKEASKKTLTIERDGKSPAWGGVMAQFEQPISEVVASETPDLSIRKSIVALVEGENGELTPKTGIDMKTGMKVRVTLFISVGRDMDYVAVTDERSACLEPADQLSSYTVSDGLWFYREVRDANTNLFFSHLPKGTHVVSYDCYISQEGIFSCGIATAQSQYSPTTVAHSAGEEIRVN